MKRKYYKKQARLEYAGAVFFTAFCATAIWLALHIQITI
jgi:hypothetical protein